MRRIFKIIFIVLLFVVVAAIAGPVQAKVSGQCADCHTMHNSQGGTPMTFDETPGVHGALVRGSCVGCHGQAAGGTNNIITDIPQILHSAAVDLAGGNFKNVIVAQGGTHAQGHNVEGIENADSTLSNTPPGYDSGYDPSSVKYSSLSRLVCAGSNGCHGNRNVTGNYEGVKGAHHADDACLKFTGLNETNQGADVATSYRFLLGVHGGEHADWQATATSASHNEYKGEVISVRTTQAEYPATISRLCAECHGVFHATSGIGTESPWLRHPTDVVLPVSGEYSAYTTYSLEAPVARKTIAAPTDVVAPGTDIVMCLSCHRAHASPWSDILRWDYDTQLAGLALTGGCFTCHTEK